MVGDIDKVQICIFIKRVFEDQQKNGGRNKKWG